MEASEKPQLPLDGDQPAGTVRALDDRLVIEQLTVSDERAAQLVRDRQARTATVVMWALEKAMIAFGR